MTVARLVVLDAGPIGLLCQKLDKPEADRLRGRLTRLESAGVIVFLPEIAIYEVRRELLRIRASSSLLRLALAQKQ